MNEDELKEYFDKHQTEIFIGIDPDVQKNGVAILNKATKQIDIKELPFFELFEYLVWKAKRMNPANTKLTVVVEGGWLNKSNWHLQAATRYVRQPLNRAAAIGYNTGENHRTGKLIVEMCKFIGVKCQVVQPLQKCWHGKDGKITQAELEYFTGKLSKRTNQDGRDAALLAWVTAGLPVKVMPKR